MNDRFTISFEELIKFYMKKWKFIAIISVLAGMIFYVVAMWAGEEIVVPPSERCVYLEGQEESLKDYIDNSVIMKMDSMNISQITFSVKNILNQEEFGECLSTGKGWDENTFRLPVKYLNEVVVWEKGEKEGDLKIQLRYFDQNSCEKFYDKISIWLRNIQEDIVITDKAEIIVSDENVLRKQLEIFDLLDDVQGELEYVAAGFTLSVSKEIALVVGILIGGILAAFLLMVVFWIDNFKSCERQRNKK